MSGAGRPGAGASVVDDERACVAVIERFYAALDDDDAARALALMSPHAVYTTDSAVLEGRGAIALHLSRPAARSAHRLSGIDARTLRADIVEVRARVVVHTSEDPESPAWDSVTISDVRHGLRQTPGGWEIATRIHQASVAVPTA